MIQITRKNSIMEKQDEVPSSFIGLSPQAWLCWARGYSAKNVLLNSIAPSKELEQFGNSWRMTKVLIECWITTQIAVLFFFKVLHL